MERGVERAENYRKQVEQTVFNPEGQGRHRLTVSIGVAPVRSTSRVSDVMREADQNLYEAKSKSRNCVVSPLNHERPMRRPDLVVISGESAGKPDV
jgi:diguanylate cyclase (GGDEF)-like protein